MVRRKSIEGAAVVQNGVAVAPEPEPIRDGEERGYYAIRHWVETGVVADGDMDSDFLDEVIGSVFYEPDRGPRQRAGRFRANFLRLNDAAEAGITPLEVMDGHSEILGELWKELFDARTDDIRESLALDLDLISRNILLLDTIEILPAHRGRSLGLAVASRLIDILGPPMGLVAICPSPLQCCPSYGDNSAYDRRFREAMRFEELPADGPRAIRRLREHWSKLGFTRLRRSSFYILSMSHPRPKLGDICDTSLL